MIARDLPTLDTRAGYSVGIVLTTPPFPYSREQVDATVGMPVLFDHAADLLNFHYGEVSLNAVGEMVTSGLYGWTMVATGTGPTVATAKSNAYRHARQVAIPDVRYRLDIGDALIAGGLARLEKLGIFAPATSADVPHNAVYVRLSLSRVHGIGVFAVRPIPKGTNLFANDTVEFVRVDRSILDSSDLTPAERRFYEDFGISRGDQIGGPVNFHNLTPGC